MEYVMHDDYGDTIVIAPGKRTPASPRVVLEFREDDKDPVAMLLTDRLARDLKQAINRSLRESERTG